MNIQEDELEEFFKNNIEAHALLALIDAKFRTDPISTQCFDERIIERIRLCVEKRKHFTLKARVVK